MVVRVIVVTVIMMMVFMFILVAIRNIVVVVAEEAFDEEHREHTGEQRNHDPAHRLGIDRCSRGNGSCSLERFRRGERVRQRMRQHVEHADAEHHARDEADGELHPAVCELKPDRNHPSHNRRDEDQRAIIGEQDSGHGFGRMLGIGCWIFGI